MLQRWAVDLGLSIPQSKIWEKILALGMAADTGSPDTAEPKKAGEQPNSIKSQGLYYVSTQREDCFGGNGW